MGQVDFIIPKNTLGAHFVLTFRSIGIKAITQAFQIVTENYPNHVNQSKYTQLQIILDTQIH